MVSIPLVTAVVSIGFLACVALVLGYFAYLGLDHTDRDAETSSAGNRSSLAD